MSLLGAKIIDYLTACSKHELPKEGIIAGQSVAEAYFRIKNIPFYTRIKDIDIFCASNHNINDSRFNKESKINYKIGYASEKKTLFLEEQNTARTTSYGDEFADILNGNLKEKIITHKNFYKISYVFELENLNIVNVKGKAKNSKSFLEAIVNCFDINMVKIGVCLTSKQVYISDDFKSFLKSKQLKIDDYKNPFKSLLRYSNKANALQGFYSDFNYEANLAYPLMELGHKKIYLKSASLESYLALNDNAKKEINKYFILKTKKHSFFKKIKIPLDYKIPYNSQMETINYKINKMIDETNFVQIIYPTIDYFIPNNNKLANKDIMALAKERYNLDKIIEYSKNQTKIKMPNQIINFRKKYTPSWNKKNIYILGYHSFETVYFIPKKRVFNQTVKDNINLLKKKKKIKTALSEISIINNKEILEMFFSSSKIKLFYNLLLKFDSKKRDSNGIKNILDFFNRLFVNNKNNKLISMLQLKFDYLKALYRHDSLTHRLNELCDYRQIEIPHKELAFKILYIEKIDISLIGLFEKNILPINILLEDFESFKIKLEGIKKNIDKNLEKLKKIEILKIDEKLLEHKDYKIQQICNPYKLKEVGQEMSHCVGGYGSYLREKRMLFFDIYNNKKERRTLSVHLEKDVDVELVFQGTNEKTVIQGIYLTYDQYKGKRNFHPYGDEQHNIKEFISNLDLKLNLELYKQNEYLLKELNYI